MAMIRSLVKHEDVLCCRFGFMISIAFLIALVETVVNHLHSKPNIERGDFFLKQIQDTANVGYRAGNRLVVFASGHDHDE